MKRFVMFAGLLLILSLTINNAQAQLRLPSIIGDSMVLQQQTNAQLWGWASAGENITLQGSWDENQKAVAVADKQGKWMASIKTPVAGGPYEITITGKAVKTLKGILIGEVWICSGQSNMEMPVQGWPGSPIDQSEDAIKNARNSSIRLFTVTKNIAYSPQEDCTGSWSSATSASVGRI